MLPKILLQDLDFQMFRIYQVYVFHNYFVEILEIDNVEIKRSYYFFIEA